MFSSLKGLANVRQEIDAARASRDAAKQGITSEQAGQLATKYQSGDQAGLQSLVNQMGVTQADVNKYFPGFDVSKSGVQLTPGIKTQEQADALAGQYWAGDKSGLQQSVSQMGVTQADVQKYFPGFDASKAGITFADQPGGAAKLQEQAVITQPTKLWEYSGDTRNRRVEKDETKINDILESWKTAGELTPAQELDLQKLGKRYGEDFLTKFQGLHTVETMPEYVSEYVVPTTYDPSFNQIVTLTGLEEKLMDDLISKYRSGETLSDKEYNKLTDYITRGQLGTVEEFLAKEFRPTTTNLFANLNYDEEQKLAELISDYANGKRLNTNKMSQLTSLLDRAGLGTVESYFATPTYTNIEGYESLFGEGEIIGASQAFTPTTPTNENLAIENFWSYSDSPVGSEQRDTEQINTILNNWRSNGELTPAEKIELKNYGQKYDTDFLTDFNEFQTQATSIEDIIREFDGYIKAGDEFSATQYARSLGLDESEIVSLLEGYGTQKSYYRPVYSLNQLKSIFEQGTAEGDQAVKNFMTATLGDEEDVQNLADTLNGSYLSATANTLNKSFNTDLTASDMKNLGEEVIKMRGNLDDPSSIKSLQTFIKDTYGIELNGQATSNIANYLDSKLQTADDIYSTYSYESLQDMSAKEMERFIENSAYNRMQEAGTLGGLLTNVFGFDSADVRGILRDVMDSEESTADPEFQRIYNRLLKNDEIDDKFQTQILSAAARLSPDSAFWKKQYDDAGNLTHDGELLYAAYKDPIKATAYADANQYGIYNGAPILNAKLVKSAFKSDTDNVLRPGELDLQGIGWNVKGNQDYPGAGVKRGIDALGIDSSLFNKDTLSRYDRVMADAAKNGFQQNENGYYLTGVGRDPEGGTYPIYENPTVEILYEGEGSSYKDITADVDKLKNVAKQLGITEYSSLSDLYDKVNNASKGLYFVAGQTTDGRLNAPEGKNHAGVFYKEVGDKLIAVSEPQYFQYKKPKKSWFSKTFGSDIGGFFEGIASLPFVAEIALIASGGNPYVYAAAKGAQVAAQPGSDLGDVLKTAGLAYLSAEVIPDLSSGMAEGIASLPGISDLPKGWSTFVSKAGTNAVIASGIAGITNQDMGDAFLNALSVSAIKSAGSGLYNALEDSQFGKQIEDIKDEFTKTAERLISTDGGEQFSFKNIDPRFKDLVQNIVIDTMFFDKDFDRSVQDNVMRLAMSGVKSAAKTKNVVDKTQTKYEV